MSASYQLARDVTEAQQMAQRLEEYLRGSELYGMPVGGLLVGDKPTLTVGALLLRLRRLTVLRMQLNDAQRQALDTAQAQHDQVQREWAVHYEAKVLKEASSRMDAMRAFFEECRDQPRQCASFYKPEALRRTIVEELMSAAAARQMDTAALEEKRRDLDKRLRSLLRPARFLWAEVLLPAYPQADYWWLYQAPPASDDPTQD